MSIHRVCSIYASTSKILLPKTKYEKCTSNTLWKCIFLTQIEGNCKLNSFFLVHILKMVFQVGNQMHVHSNCSLTSYFFPFCYAVQDIEIPVSLASLGLSSITVDCGYNSNVTTTMKQIL